MVGLDELIAGIWATYGTGLSVWLRSRMHPHAGEHGQCGRAFPVADIGHTARRRPPTIRGRVGRRVGQDAQPRHSTTAAAVNTKRRARPRGGATGHIGARSWLPEVSEARGSRGGHSDAAAPQVSYDTVIASGTRRGLERVTRVEGDVNEPYVV